MNSIIAERGIVSLFHFTQADNLKNILRYGLMPRGDIEITGIASEFNDKYRYDDCLDAVCISISFPNYKSQFLFSTHPYIHQSNRFCYQKN